MGIKDLLSRLPGGERDECYNSLYDLDLSGKVVPIDDGTPLDRFVQKT